MINKHADVLKTTYICQRLKLKFDPLNIVVHIQQYNDCFDGVGDFFSGVGDSKIIVFNI